MLKHSNLTLNRILRTHQVLIQDRLIRARVRMDVKMLSEPCATQAEALACGGWVKVEEGHGYGPAYQVFWFRVRGRIPEEWAGREVAALAPVGGERTVWVENVPERGIDGPHHFYRVSDEAVGGAEVDLTIQAYTMNPQVRVWGDSPPRESVTDRVGVCELVCLDTARIHLHYDVLFARSLLEGLQENDPAHATILRGLNDMCNRLGDGRDENVSGAGKVLRDALGTLGGEVKHAITAVGHAHLDTAWLWPLHITRLKMAHTVANQLYLINRYPGQYVFAHSQASQYEWLEQEYPELFERVKVAVKSGQWEPVGSMWVEADCNLSGGEALVRQFLYGRQYFRDRLGYETEDMWLPDVFGYSAAIPQILEKFGIRYFMTQKISWNQTNKFPHNTFQWQGIDGTKIWSHFPPADTYIGSGHPKEVLESVRKHRDQGRSDASLYLFGWGDGGGGPTEEHLELLKRGRRAAHMPEIELNRRALDFFREARRSSRDLMTWSGELYLEMHRGTLTSQAANKKQNRECEFLLRDAELLAAFQSDPYPAEDLEKSWKLVLLNQFHDIIPGSSVREVVEDSNRDYAIARELASNVLQAALTDLGVRLDASECECPLAVFKNATVASIEAIPWDERTAPGSLVCDEQVLPVQVIEAFGERKLAFVTPDAALGAVAVADLRGASAPPMGRLKARDRRLENDEWCVRFDSNGNIVSITALDGRNTEFIEPGKVANLFQLHEDRPHFWDAWDIDPWAYETVENLVKADSVEIVERGPVRVAMEIVRRISDVSWIRQRISLGHSAGIRFDTEIEWRENRKLLKVAFPLNLNATRATYEIQFGHVERATHQNTSWDWARFEVPAQKWVDVSQGDVGVALLNDGKYGYDCAGSTLRMSLLRAPKSPDPECDMGRHRFSYVLQPHFGSFRQSEVVANAYALNAPIRHTRIAHGDGAAASTPRLVEVLSPNLVVEAVKKAERSDHLVVRLYECHNTRGVAEVGCAIPVKRATLANLEERPEGELEIVDGLIQVPYRPFEILTLLLEV